MARKGWESLSTDYRDRLERNGISRRDYESGISLEKGRGHAATPEHPERAESKPEKYREYLAKREELVNYIIREKARMFGSAAHYSAKRSRKHVNVKLDGKSRSLASLRRVANSIKEALANGSVNWESLTEGLEDEDVNALYYH